MKLIDLNPRWFSVGVDQEGWGISFLCPHCMTVRLGVRITHEQPHVIDGVHVWKSEGDDPKFDEETHSGFENITLNPSVDASSIGHWHGFIKNGEIT